MAINLTLRLVKGSQLTFKEMDDNFLALKAAIEALSSVSLISGGSGYIKFNNNWMAQWGTGRTSTGRMDTISFPVAFNTTCTSVVIVEADAIGWDYTPVSLPNCSPTVYGATSITKTNFQLSGARMMYPKSQYQGGITYNYLAFGY